MNKFVVSAFVALALVACGQKEAPPAEVAQTPAAAPAPTPVAAAATNPAGEKLFKATCALCHASGTAGAPIPGAKDDWGPRVAQGKEVLYKHALEGFTGQKGAMPAKGGNVAASDDDVKAAVDYMLSKLN